MSVIGRFTCSASDARLALRFLPEHLDGDVELGRPGPVRPDRDRRTSARSRRTRRAATTRSPSTARRCRAGTSGGASRPSTRFAYEPFFCSASLTSNRSAKSLSASIRTVRSTGSSSWFRIDSFSGKPLPTDTLADHRQRRVHVDAPDPGDEEEPGLEVLQVVGRQRGETLAVHGEHPLRQEPGVEREQPGRVGRRRLDVAPPCR